MYICFPVCMYVRVLQCVYIYIYCYLCLFLRVYASTDVPHSGNILEYISKHSHIKLCMNF